MAVWELSTEYKKNAIEVQLWTKDGITIKKIEGYRWGTFYCESDERPDIDLRNPDGYELADYDWELDSLDDGCWSEWEYPDSVSEEEREKIEAAWDENWYDGMEELGWSNDDTEYHFQGPLKLVNRDTGEEFSVLDENFNIIPEEHGTVSQAELEEALEDLKREFEELQVVNDDPPLTNWFPADVNPVREGRYQINDNKNPQWPFPTYADWDGKKWSEDSIEKWRGLAEDPNK
jgi:hypothetical protein